MRGYYKKQLCPKNRAAFHTDPVYRTCRSALCLGMRKTAREADLHKVIKSGAQRGPEDGHTHVTHTGLLSAQRAVLIYFYNIQL